MKYITLLLLLVFAGACTRVTHDLTQYPPLTHSAEEILIRHKTRTPQKFKVLNSIVFHYRRQKMTALGYTEINAENKAFSVAGLNPMGMKLFQLSGEKGEITTHHVIDQLAEFGDISEAVGIDVQRIYFNRVPSSLHYKVYANRIEFFDRNENSEYRYIFAGKDPVLVEKSYYEGGEKIWEIIYSNYSLIEGYLYPQTIRFNHKQYRYQLRITMRELLEGPL